MIRIDEIAYLMQELSLLSDHVQGFKDNFLEVIRKEKKDKMINRFIESDKT